jgi:hypothetical protein
MYPDAGDGFGELLEHNAASDVVGAHLLLPSCASLGGIITMAVRTSHWLLEHHNG